MVRQIPLHSSVHPDMFALVDDDDDAIVERHRWYVKGRGGRLYAYTTIARRTVFMHRMITAAPRSRLVDHINHNGLDNRRSNLRMCTNAENQRNRSGLARHNSSGFTGVYPTPEGRWRARIWINGRVVNLGHFDTPEEAARARDEAAVRFHGPFASLNARTPEVRR